MPPLNVKISFVVASVRRNNGVIDTLFSLPGGLPDEYISANLLISRGEPKIGQRYKISIAPEFPNERTNTMSKQYQGKAVTVVRDAKQGDQGFDPAKDQVWIRNADGTENVALRKDVTDAP